MTLRLPPLDSLRVLAACVRHHNFSRAAAELGITAAAVSQRMHRLEEQLGVRLFGRHGPRLIVTDRAKALGQRVEQALSSVSAAVDDCRRSRRVLRVTCAPTFAARWLLPRLAGYHALSGADSIALDAAQDMRSPGDFDVAIRSGVGPWHGCEGVKLLAEAVTPMLSPRLAPARGRLTVKGLLALPLIPAPQWAQWFEIAGVPNAKARYFATRFPNFELEAQAAASGVGVALLSPVLYADLTAQGILVAPFSWSVPCRSSYWLLWKKGSSEPHFASWLKSQFAT